MSIPKKSTVKPCRLEQEKYCRATVRVLSRFASPNNIKADTVNAEKRHSYAASEKLIVVSYALKHTQAEASNKYGVHKSMVSRWVRDYWKIQNAIPDTKRIGGGPGISPNRCKSVDSESD